MALISKTLLIRHVVVNILISSLILLVIWYSSPFIAGPWFTVKLVLDAPAFIILALLKGMNEAMHFTTEAIYRVVSFIFYSTVIALIQTLIYRHRKKKRGNIP